MTKNFEFHLFSDEQIQELKHEFALMVKTLIEEENEKRKPRYLSRKQVAELLGVTLPSVHRYVNDGVLKVYYLEGSKKPYFIEQEITQAMQQGVLGKYCRKGARL